MPSALEVICTLRSEFWIEGWHSGYTFGYSALDDLQNGFLVGQEFIISAALFDDVLEQAKHLCNAGYKDPAAVLGRVVIEDAIRKIARKEAVDDSGKISGVNDRLKTSGRFTQPLWRQLQSWIDIGNAAAHGNR